MYKQAIESHEQARKDFLIEATDTMTETDLIHALCDNAKRGAFPITIEALTVPTMRKTGNPYAGNCLKRSRVNGFANWIYSNSVNRQREREGTETDFIAAPRQWGARVEKTPLVIHKGKMYLELKVEKSLGHQYETLTGKIIEASELAPFLSEKSEGSGRQGTEKEIVLRDYAIASIHAVSLDGRTYRVTHEPPAPIAVSSVA